MFKTIYRVIEKNKNGKTTYVVQEKFFLFWWNLSEPLEDEKLANGLCFLLEMREKYCK